MESFYDEIAKDCLTLGKHPDFKDHHIFYNHKKKIGFIDISFIDKDISDYYIVKYRETRNQIIDKQYLSKQKIRASSQYSFIVKCSNALYFENILDIGTSTGALLKEFENTSNLYGFEPDINMFNYAKENLKKACIFNNIFEPSQLPMNLKFDLITLSHVFEHFTQPIEKLHLLLNLIRKDGFIFIEVPYDDRRLIKQVVNSNYVGLYHTYFYQPQSIKSIVERAGGKVVSLEIYGYNHIEFNYEKQSKTIVKQKWITFPFKIWNYFFYKPKYTNHNDIYFKAKRKGTWIRVLIKNNLHTV